MSLLGLLACRRRRQINPAAGSRFPPAASSFRRHSAEEATWARSPRRRQSWAVWPDRYWNQQRSQGLLNAGKLGRTTLPDH